jgi:predicted RNA-binding protein with PIN domain
MRYLIDGYNLLHAMGLLIGKVGVGPHGLEKARLGLLGRLAASFGEAGNLTVVFDASHALSGADAQQEFQGIRIHYTQTQEADDLIEELIRRDAAPRSLTVVSNDRRLKDAARRRQCLVLGCEDFLDEMERLRRSSSPRPPEKPAKPEQVSDDETEHWLREFGDLADDPKLRGWVDLGRKKKNK